MCRRRLRTVVASLALQSPRPSWCPGLGRLLASAAVRVWPQDLEPTTNGPPITRTIARFIQAPAQDPLVCSSTRQCWLQLWVSCTVVRRCCDCAASSAPTTKCPDSTPFLGGVCMSPRLWLAVTHFFNIFFILMVPVSEQGMGIGVYAHSRLSCSWTLDSDPIHAPISASSSGAEMGAELAENRVGGRLRRVEREL